MKRSVVAACTVAVLIAGPATAVEPEPGARVGSGPAEIAAALAESGYTIRKYEAKGRRLEVRAVRDGRRVAFQVDAATGTVVAVGPGPDAGLSAWGGPDDESIRAALRQQGYAIVKVERKRREIEVYADRDGRRWELKIDPRTGDVLRIEAED